MTKPSDLKPLLCGRDDYAWADDLPERLAAIIEKPLLSKNQKNTSFSEISWKRLGQIVSDYLEQRQYSKGFLNKTQADQLDKIARQAGKLCNEISKLQKLEADWFLISELDDAGIDEHTFAAAMKTLSATSVLQPKSPKIEEDNVKKNRWLNEHLRADLQVNLDLWWEQNTGLPNDVPEIQNTPYAKFLEQLLSCIKLHNQPGYSHGAVNTARQIASNRILDDEKRSRKFSKILARAAKQGKRD